MDKPADIFDRTHEWQALSDFMESDLPGAALGLVYGRRRQGKTYLLETLTQAYGGFYFAALEQSSQQNLRRLASQYQAFTKTRASVTFDTWDQAFEALLALGQNASKPIPVVIDEFPYLLDVAPELPSLLQVLLSPRSEAVTAWKTRFVLCGSALSTMKALLSGTAPLRGRASLELIVRPFDYRDSAEFWNVQDDPDLAMRLHALVGGTPAYRSMCGNTTPKSSAKFDQWVQTALLNPSSAMFREGNVLLSEEDRVIDTAPYFSLLGAISQGKTRRSEIATTVGKTEGALAHPLSVLTEAQLISPLDDAVKQKRTTYHIAEPILRLHQLVVAPNEARLVRHNTQVWEESAETVSSNIYGPHFENLSRIWCAEHASEQTLGGVASTVAPTEVACAEHRSNHEIDVVVTAKKTGESPRIIALGEAKWRSEPCSKTHLDRLEHLRVLMNGAADAKILIFSRRGFTKGLVNEAASRQDVELIDVKRLYQSD